MFSLVNKFYTVFLDRELSLNAASLSFYTILTIIPLLIIIMSIISYLDLFIQMHKEIQEIIISNFIPMNQELILSYIDTFLQHSMQISLFSFMMLFASSLLFFQNYEYVVNKIFKVKQRPYIKSLGIYILLIFIAPTFMAFAFYISASIATLISSNILVESLNVLPFISNIIIWFLFFLLIKLSPNKNVSFKASIISSLVVAVVFSIAKEMFVYYIFFNKSYTTLYGSFSILMFLFIWIYTSWYIFLQGLNLCYHIDSIEKDKKTL